MRKQCCHGDCNQGRRCPRDVQPDSLPVSVFAALFCAACIGSPFVLWLMGYPK